MLEYIYERISSMPYGKFIILFLIIFFPVTSFLGCGGRYALIYPIDNIMVLLSKKSPPLRFELPGTNWLISRPSDSLVVFREKGPQLKEVKLQYISLKNADWYTPNVSNELLLEEYYKWEEEFLKRDPYLKVQLVDRNISGPSLPNIVWMTEGKDFKAHGVSFIKNEKQMVLYDVGGLPNEKGKESLFHLFRSIKFLTESQVDELAKTEASYIEPLSSFP